MVDEQAVAMVWEDGIVTALEQGGVVVVSLKLPPYRLVLDHTLARQTAEALYDRAALVERTGLLVALDWMGLPGMGVPLGDAKRLAVEMFQAAYHADLALGGRWTVADDEIRIGIVE